MTMLEVRCKKHTKWCRKCGILLLEQKGTMNSGVDDLKKHEYAHNDRWKTKTRTITSADKKNDWR